MQSKSDAQLLREYAKGGGDAAFAELVRRHTNLVYSSALRQSDSADAAAEIAQSVFVDLARQAVGAGSIHVPAANTANASIEARACWRLL